MRCVRWKIVVLCALVAVPAVAQTNPITVGSITVQLEVLTTLPAATTGAPNWGTNVGDSRLFVTRQNGEIRVVDTTTAASSTFLNVATSLSGTGTLIATGEQGLLGLAFHPNYNAGAGTPGRGKFYTYTSENPGSDFANAPHFSHPELGSGNGSHQSVIREWTVNLDTNPNVVDTGAGSRVLIRIRQPQTNHNGGGLTFGNDGYLYISSGDGGGGNDHSGGEASTSDGHTNRPGPGLPRGNGQDITNAFGKILRIKTTTDVDANTTASANGQYRLPNSNPFAGATTGLDEIFAYGLRNPFRISTDKATGNIYTGDVGQGQREEVDLVLNGANYGWVTREGTRLNDTEPGLSTAGLVAPIGEYTHSDGISVIGGFVYRGDKIPSLVGKYVFGDFRLGSLNRGRLFYMDVNNPGPNTIFEFAINPSIDPLPTSNLHGFGEGANGQIYALFANGQVVEIVPEPSSVLLAAVGFAGVLWWRRRHPRQLQ